MYEIAVGVAACLRANTRVGVAWVVQTSGFNSGDAADAVALTPGGGRIGSLLSGAVDDRLADRFLTLETGRLIDLTVTNVDVVVAGLSGAGEARCLLVPGDQLPAELWDRLVDRAPVCLVTQLDGDEVGVTQIYTAATIGDAPQAAAQLFARRVSATTATDEFVITVLWPVPKLVVVGMGAQVDALLAAASLLGWHTRSIADVDEVSTEAAQLTPIDKLVVMAHDDEVAGPALVAGLAGRAGYIGALGGRRVQQGRAVWLAERGVTDLARVHGPAGLDIGANTPAEIAVSILAEALAVSMKQESAAAESVPSATPGWKTS